MDMAKNTKWTPAAPFHKVSPVHVESGDLILFPPWLYEYVFFSKHYFEFNVYGSRNIFLFCYPAVQTFYFVIISNSKIGYIQSDRMKRAGHG